jgi:hypothetical protein
MNTRFKHTVLLALAISAVCASGVALADEPYECDPPQTAWTWVINALDDLFGIDLKDHARVDLGDECGDTFW